MGVVEKRIAAICVLFVLACSSRDPADMNSMAPGSGAGGATVASNGAPTGMMPATSSTGGSMAGAQAGSGAVGTKPSGMAGKSGSSGAGGTMSAGAGDDAGSTGGNPEPMFEDP